MTCKDCIHHDLCMDKFKKQYSMYANKNITVDDCEHFKNKADFVEVIRCQNCENKAGEVNRCGDVYCSLHQGWFDKEAFCSYGERKSVTDTNVGGK